MRVPEPVDGGGLDLRERLAGSPGLFVALDFDGTLAPIVPDPDEATIETENQQALEQLVESTSAAVAVVSGRSLTDLVRRIDVEDLTLAGNHGLELRRGDERIVHPEAREHRPAITAVSDLLEETLVDISGAFVEHKDLSASVHYRRTPRPQGSAVESAVTRAVTAAPGDLQIVEGKEVFEIRPRIERDKGTVVSELAAPLPDDWLSVYVGDDTTDEDAFRVVAPEGVAVLVGESTETNATHRLPTQEHVAPFLTWLATAALQAD
jgi:trehalose 6-phosphate phosphatase